MNYDLELYNALRALQIPAHVRGYRYIQSAMTYLQANPNAIYAITTELYPAIAEMHNTKPSRVERAIRHAISLATTEDAKWYKVMGRTGHFANAEFLACLNESIWIKLAMAE